MNKFAAYLVNSKIYSGLETSFGKSIESEMLGFYPQEDSHWETPLEKDNESRSLQGLSNEEKARRRNISVWREVDKSFVQDDHRFLLSIKSGPNCINDTQVESMKNAIVQHHDDWFNYTRQNYPQVTTLDIVICLTYGTDWTTNNKENQILIKLMENGFHESEQTGQEGILLSDQNPNIRVYRKIGKNFWALVGNPVHPELSEHIFLEAMLGLFSAAKNQRFKGSMESLVNAKIQVLSSAISSYSLPQKILPNWIAQEYNETELAWFLSAISSFFDIGI